MNETHCNFKPTNNKTCKKIKFKSSVGARTTKRSQTSIIRRQKGPCSPLSMSYGLALDRKHSSTLRHYRRQQQWHILSLTAGRLRRCTAPKGEPPGTLLQQTLKPSSVKVEWKKHLPNHVQHNFTRLIIVMCARVLHVCVLFFCLKK